MKYAVLVDQFDVPKFGMPLEGESPDILAVSESDGVTLYHLEETGIVDVYKKSVVAEVRP